MALPTTGQISLSSIKNEFGPYIPNVPVNISSYYKGPVGDKFALVRNTGVNIKVPTSGTISLSSFRGAVKYAGVVTIYVVAETASQYANSNNGYVSAYLNGNSPSCTITIGGRTTTQALVAGAASWWNGLYYDSSDNVGVIITDTSGTYTFGPFSIGYGAGTRTFTYTL